jgi:gas vesicle protein
MNADGPVVIQFMKFHEQCLFAVELLRKEGPMEKDQKATRLGPMNMVLAPLVACAVMGGAALMIGRPKSVRSGRRPKNATKSWTDPKVQKAVETAQRALDDARVQLSSRDPRALQDEITRRAGSAAGMTRDNMTPLMKDAGDRARELAERLLVEGQTRSADLNQRVRSDVAPKAKTLAQEAVDEAEEIIGMARKRAVQLSGTARREYGPELAQGANALAGLIAAGSSAGVHMLRERSDEMRRQGRKQRARRGVAKGRDKTTAALQAVGGQMKYAATESVMVTFWAAACAATIYFAILTNEQRDRLKRFFSGAVSQIQDVVSDFNDVGEEFQTRS